MPRPDNTGRPGTYLIAVAVVAIFGIGTIRYLAEEGESALAGIVIGNLIWVPLLLFINVLLRRERQYRWHILIGGTLLDLAIVAAGIIAQR